MNKSTSCSNDEKSSSENFSYIPSESMHLNESFDSNQDSKSKNIAKKNKFLSFKPRKWKEDNIRKKIKTSALKTIIKKINKQLKKAGSKYTFKAFPQHFIADISRKINHEVMHLTFRELFEYTYQKLINDENYKSKEYNKNLIEAAEDKYKKNCITIEYLDSNQEESLKSVWESIKNTEYVDLLRDFFNSQEFKKSIVKLKEDKDYINSYKYFAKNYVEFFLNYEPIEKDDTNQRLGSSSRITSNDGTNNRTSNPEYHPFIIEVEPILDFDAPNILDDGLIHRGDYDLFEILNSFSNDNLMGLNRSLNNIYFDMILN